MNRIDRIAARIASDLAWYGWRDEDTQKAIEKLKPEQAELERLAPSVLRGIKKRFPKAILNTKFGLWSNPRPGAVLDITGKYPLQRMLLVRSMHKTSIPWPSSPITNMADEADWYVEGYSPDDANPWWNEKFQRVPTARDVMKVFDMMVAKVGEQRVAEKVLGIDIWERAGVVKPTLQEVQKFVYEKSRMEPDDTRDLLLYSTREHGSVGDERPGVEDIRMMKKLRDMILDKFGSNNLSVQVETVDEWTDLEVRLK